MTDINKILVYSHQLTVLYVEDDKTVREHTHDILEDLFAQVIVAEDGEDDCFAKLGGDEFIMVMIRKSKEEVLNRVMKIQDNISRTDLLLSYAVSFTVSMGMSEVQYLDEEIDAVIKRADSLYKEKHTKKQHYRT